jgi:hypothetical protein
MDRGLSHCTGTHAPWLTKCGRSCGCQQQPSTHTSRRSSSTHRHRDRKNRICGAPCSARWGCLSPSIDTTYASEQGTGNIRLDESGEGAELVGLRIQQQMRTLFSVSPCSCDAPHVAQVILYRIAWASPCLSRSTTSAMSSEKCENCAKFIRFSPSSASIAYLSKIDRVRDTWFGAAAALICRLPVTGCTAASIPTATGAAAAAAAAAA